MINATILGYEDVFMKSKTIVIKCDSFGHNVVIDRATAMWIGEETERQLTLNPEQIISTFFIDTFST